MQVEAARPLEHCTLASVHSQSQQPLISNWSFAERDNIVRPSGRPSAPNRTALHITNSAASHLTSSATANRSRHTHNGRQAHHWCMLLLAPTSTPLQLRLRPARPFPRLTYDLRRCSVGAWSLTSPSLSVCPLHPDQPDSVYSVMFLADRASSPPGLGTVMGSAFWYAT